ncbi:RagB/SusD family nutrient uptake outer membrane protein [Algoriphagus resistens]|uniref:RagB/SusD family nutrient uptake outer membrane protein n=1 Tax=Algoriphagus resistens TaxID=1750590 RepID=UPI0007167B05|nr:RagB/SusD family nutrient uptake outer membrane protein [Algoriphagus resistens]
MKNTLYKISTLVAFALLGIMTSCSDEFTDLEPLGSTSYENFFHSEQDAIEAANSLYFYMKDEDMFSRGFFWYINASDDMVTGRINSTADNIKNFNMTGDEGYAFWMYPQSYKIIRRANDIILNVPDMELTTALKNRILGEAYFMRAFHYFWLAHTYGDDVSGGVPIVTELNMFDDAGSYARPTSVTENYAQIIEDLKKASELLPLFTTYSAEDKGRAHKDAALAYMAKTYLYWAEYDPSRYAEVVTAVDAVTNSGSGRAVYTTGNPAEDFRLLHSHLNNWGSEYIWTVVSGVNGGSKLPGVSLENKGWGKYNGWGYYMPTNELYEEFEEGDFRREVTILKFGDDFKFFGENRRYQSENSLSGLQFNKYLYEYQYENPVGTYINSNGDDPTTILNVPLMRYSELLLMKAEALIMQGQNGDEPLNKIRVRAGLEPKTNATMADLKHERRVELAGEFANRHFDLVRWGDAEAAYSKPLHGQIHTNKADPDSPFTVEVIWPARNFDPATMGVWPIPNRVLNSSGIPQNQGW